jgi:hypothetical protein
VTQKEHISIIAEFSQTDYEELAHALAYQPK